MEEKGLEIFNGRIRGDEEEELLFTGGMGETVIDYIVGSVKVRERIREMKIGKMEDKRKEIVRKVEEERGSDRGHKGKGRG